MKTMYDNLHNLDAYIDDSTLVLNLLRGLNKKFDSLKTVLKRSKPFPSFCKAQNDLQLEELMLDAEATSGSASAFTRPPPPSVRLALRLPPAVAVAVVAAAAVAVRLPPAAAREPFLALLLQPLDWHHQHVAKPVHGCSFVPSIATLACLRHYTTPQPSDIADGGLLVILDSMVYEVGPTVPR
jgi:hypothetical protein